MRREKYREEIIKRVKELRNKSDKGQPEDIGRLDGYMEGFATASNYIFESLEKGNTLNELVLWGELHKIAFGSISQSNK